MQRKKEAEIIDAEALAAYRKTGDQEELGKLYNKYMHLVYGLCLKYLEDSSLAQDAVIDIYEHLVKKLKTHEVDYFKSWLYIVTKNHCLGKLRKQNMSMHKEKEAHRMYSEQIFHPDSVSDPEMLKRLKECMAKLSGEQKECIQLFYLQEKSYHEICTQLTLPWNRVRSYVQNGRRNLKKCMTKA